VYKIVRNTSKLTALGALAALSLAVVAAQSLHLPEPAAAQQAGGVQSLRGETGIPDDSLKPVVAPQKTQEGSFARAYRQQPPLIPHTIDEVEISLKENGCLQCHEWPYNVDQDAPKVSETHYVDRDGPRPGLPQPLVLHSVPRAAVGCQGTGAQRLQIGLGRRVTGASVKKDRSRQARHRA
jgi:cytochrome c-type protein NapB